MSFHILPRDIRFFDLFVRDAENLHEAADKLKDMLENYDRLEERVAEIQVLEHRGDEIDREISARLDEAFITPFDREDIHDLTVQLDDVVDGVQAIAETLVIYAIDHPTDEARRLGGMLAAQAGQLVEATRKLDGLKDLEPHLLAVHELEHQADGLSRAAIGRLFSEGGDPLEVIKWREIYGLLEDAIDAAEDAAEVMEKMYHKTA